MCDAEQTAIFNSGNKPNPGVRRAPCKVGAFPAGANPARPLSLRPVKATNTQLETIPMQSNVGSMLRCVGCPQDSLTAALDSAPDPQKIIQFFRIYLHA